ncbi:MAG: T9SS type A sorting domain-containing protein [Bacteroidota bacterium]
MKKLILISGILLVSVFSTDAQVNFQKTYGGELKDACASMQQTSDGGYIMAGGTESFGFAAEDVYLIKTDADGNTLWSKTYGGSSGDAAWSVQQTYDGGYIIAGVTESFYPNKDVYVIKTDSNGAKQWSKIYGGSGDDVGMSVQQTIDGGYVVAGTTLSFGAGGDDIYLIKTDAGGDTLWTKTYGGTTEDRGFSVQQTTDGGYIITGSTSSFGAGNRDFYLIKTDASGNVLWTKTYGGNEFGKCNTVKQTDDGGYILAGKTLSFGLWPGVAPDIYVVKTDTVGDTLWTKTYGITASASEAYCIEQTADGGYIIAAATLGLTGADGYLLKIDNNGNIQWTKIYGGTADDIFFSAKQITGGRYIVAGATASFGGGGGDAYMIKTDANGNILCTDQAPPETITGNPSTIMGTTATIIGSGSDIPFFLDFTTNPPTQEKNIPVLPLSICLVTVDSATSTRNEIVWGKPLVTYVDSFRIYRNITNTYTYIGSVPYDTLSVFIDTTIGINPQITSYRYKISLIDSCGNESELSDYHETIHLTVYQGSPPKINLVWDNYEGIPFAFYYILRDSMGTHVWEVIDSVDLANTTYTDLDPPSDPRYVIQVVHPDGCTATKEKNYNSSLSNRSTAISAPLLSTIVTVHDAGQDSCNGSATVSVTGGIPPYSYLWSTSPFQYDSIATGLCPGNYSVQVTDVFGNTTTATVTVSEQVGVDELSASWRADFGLRIYPNPGRGVFTVECQIDDACPVGKNDRIGGKWEMSKLRIYDVLGRVIWSVGSWQLSAGNNKIEIDLSRLPAGVYHLQVITDKILVNRKVVIE